MAVILVNAQTKSILIVEDDIELAQWIIDYLTHKGFSCFTTPSGREALALIASMQPDLVILDGMLPDLDGFEVCRKARPTFAKPIIMLTARDEEVDEVLGLEAGADDYLIKPVRARALFTRINKLLNAEINERQLGVDEPEQTGAQDHMTFKHFSIDRASRIVMHKGTQLDLSSHEFETLWYLASRAGSTVHREELIQELRGFEFDGYDRSIDLRISRLRRKLGDDSSNPRIIKTIWGKGYLFAKDD